MRYLGLVLIVLLLACSSEEDKVIKPGFKEEKTFKQLKDSAMIEKNKKWSSEDKIAIADFAKRNQLNFKETGTGLHYQIYKEGSGEYPKKGQLLTVNYTVKLLDGTLIYSSDSLGEASFVLEKEDLESGLHEGMKLLKKGGKGIFVLPYHQAHGLTGDNNKIKPLTVVVYNIELIEIE